MPFCLISQAQQYTSWEVEYQAFGNYSFYGDKFYIKSQNPNMQTDDVQFKSYSSYISRLFTNKSATRVYNEAEANIIVYVYCSISGPYEERGVYNTPQVSIPSGNYVWTFGGPRTYSITHYKRDLGLNVYNKNGDNLWKINAHSEGGSNDYSYVLPLICYAIRNVVGNSGSNKVELTDYDAAARFFR